MAGKKRYTVKEVVAALHACQGLVYLAAEKLGCTSATIINYQNRYPSIRAVVLEKRGRRVDVAEAALDKAVLNGEAWAVQFLLRTQGKDRGYGDRQEIAHTTAGEAKVVNDADRDRIRRILAERLGLSPGPAGSHGRAAQN